MVKVSVVIPVYNVEKYLEECLESIINQTLKDIEIICINDGSTDNSLNILNKYAKKDNRIIVISQKNQGQAVARNNGMVLKPIRKTTAAMHETIFPTNEFPANSLDIPITIIASRHTNIMARNGAFSHNMCFFALTSLFIL